MEEEKFRSILILIAMKLPFLPSVRPMRNSRVGKQNFTQVLPSMGKLVQPSPGISILLDAHIVLFSRS